PFLVIHGEADGMVPIAQSELLVAALKEAGVEVTFVRLPGVGHSFSGPPSTDQEVDPAFLEPTLGFFDRHLKAPPLGEATPEVISAPSELTWVRLGGPPGGLGYDIRMRPDNPDIMFVTDANAGIHKSTDGGRTWFSVNEGITPMGNGIYPVFSATIDPHDYDTVWIGTQNIGHVYRSTDGGQTWEERDEGVVENGRSVRGITVDPNNPNIVYAGVEVSSFAWRGEPFARRHDLVQGEVYKSTDAGRSWTRIWVGNNLARYIWVDPRNSNRIYVSTGIFDRDAADSDVPNRVWGGVGILRSDDGGQTWTVLDEDNGLGGRYIPSLFMHPTNPDILLAAVTGTGDTPGAYVTYDGGDTWQLVLAVPEGFGMEAVEISTSHPDVWYVAAEGQIWRSDDAGQTWQHFMLGTWDRAAGLPIDLQVDPRDPYRIFDNNYGGGNFLSTDGGATWVDASQGYTGNKLAFNIATVPDNPWRVFAGDFYSEDGGTTWFGAEFKGAAAFAFIADPQTQATHVIVGGSNGSVWHSRDGGQTWEGEVKVVDLMAEVAAGRIKTDVMPMRALAVAPSDTREAYAGFADGACPEAIITVKCFEATPGLHRSHDGGYTWEKVSDTPFTGVGILSLAVHPDDSKVLYAGTATGLYLSRDGGDTWQHLASLDAVTRQVPILDLDLFPVELEASLVRDVKFDPFNANVLYVASTPGGVYRSDDGGNTWRQVAAGMDPNEPVSYLLPDPNRPGVIYASSAFSGVFVTTDGAQTWQRLTEGLTVSNVRGLALSADGAVLYAGTVGGGMFRLGKPAGPLPQGGPIAEPSPISTEPAPLPTPPTATPQIAAFPPKPTPEPQARGAIRGRGICPGMVALPLALVGLVWVNRRRR
ncbi:MAG: prolyl oligopeptidase family serine peptidase, partial [Anaerolineae bacterium]